MDDRSEFHQQAEALFQMVVDRIPGIIWSTDTDLRFTSSMGAGLSALNLRPGQVVGMSLFDFFQTTNPDFLAIAVHRRALGGEAVDFVQVWSGRTFQVHIRPLLDNANRIAGCMGFAQDITEAQRTFQELLAERDRVQRYLDIAGVILVVLDKNGCITLLNRRGYEVLGYEEGVLLGKNWFETCLPGHTRPLVSAAFEQLMMGQLESAEHFENPVLTRSGEERIIAWHNTLLADEDGTRIGTLSSGEDITERRLAENALQQAHAELERRVEERTTELAGANEQLRYEIEERRRAEKELCQSHEELQAIYDGMTDGLLIADVQTTRFVRANDTICRMLGYTQAELLKLSVTDIHPDADLPRVLETFLLLAHGKLQVAEGLPVQRKDGSVFYADIATGNILYQERPCMIGFFRDITERRHSQEALRQEREVLKHLLASSDQERQMIAYEIHDVLAQQIAGAKMQFEVFSHRAHPNTADAELAQAETARLLDESMTEVRRLIGGLRPPILDEKGIVAAIEHFVHDDPNHVGLQIEFHSDVRFDRLEPTLENALLRMVQEGVNNSKRHGRSDRVRIELLQSEKLLRLEIRDWGVGFDPTTATAGFGLEGIRQRARLHGGSASVVSTPGQGTVIVVDLPVVECLNP